MGIKAIRALLIAIAYSLAFGAPVVSAQEQRRTYTIAEVAPGAAERLPQTDKALDNSSAATRSDKPEVFSVRFMAWENFSRVMLELSQEARYEVHRLQADPSKGLPPRIYIDVFGANLATGSKEPIKVDDGIVRQIRLGQYTQDTVRAVLDVASNKDYTVSQLTDPYRIILDVRGDKPAQVLASVDRAAPAAAPAKPEAPPAKPEPMVVKPDIPVARPEPPSVKPEVASAPKPQPVAPKPEVLNERAASVEIAKPPPVKDVKPRGRDAKPTFAGLKKIVLDPGHGGKDPGAIGVHGVAEKDIVLKVAKKLAAKLRDSGIQVVLTRTDDRFIKLEDRTAIANKEDADLFISLHMNASPNGEAKGLETYYLDNTTDEASLRLAARENGTSTSNVSDLQFILSDMTQNMKLEDSVTLAHRLHESLLGSMSAKLGDVRDLGVKKALFYVLVGARMPSVLMEMFFITNKGEGRAMSQEAYQDIVVEALFEGIQRYSESVLTAKTL
ncbi:MAG TPA: N-acetylmuramoyl-L-alanine amidase [Candidatus Binatia bacterium]